MNPWKREGTGTGFVAPRCFVFRQQFGQSAGGAQWGEKMLIVKSRLPQFPKDAKDG